MSIYRLKRHIFIISAALLVVVLFTVLLGHQWQKAKQVELPISNLRASYSINVQDPAVLMGDSDLCFIANVDNLVGTEYLHAVEITDTQGTRTVRLPYTKYEVSIVEPIKGQIEVNQKSISVKPAVSAKASLSTICMKKTFCLLPAVLIYSLPMSSLMDLYWFQAKTQRKFIKRPDRQRMQRRSLAH